MLYIGIDPGQKGYLSYYYKELGYCPLYSKKNDLVDKLIDIYTPNNIVYIEQATAYKGQGTKSINTYLINFGKLLGVMETLNYNIKLITPRTWQKYFNIKSTIKVPKGLDKKTKNMLKYKQRKEVKEQAIKKASKIWGIEVKDNNLADSLLILKFCIDKEEKND